tara:strand:- start:59 stop:205 length:147 start_codon:yes stop_codon:yes gene_type:complete
MATRWTQKFLFFGAIVSRITPFILFQFTESMPVTVMAVGYGALNGNDS